MNNAEKILGLIKEAFNQAQGGVTRKPQTRVQFDSQTESPFVVVFSERGFQIDGTRLSFEALEDAISKEYNITLKRGAGMELDAVKMQKILKYKDLY